MMRVHKVRVLRARRGRRKAVASPGINSRRGSRYSHNHQRSYSNTVLVQLGGITKKHASEMTSALFILALVATLAVVADAAAPRSTYCSLKSCRGPNHTVCKHTLLRTANTCGKVTSSTVTSAEIKELLEIHNKHRAYVASGKERRGSPGPQPAATNLGSLVWDNELAEIAQTWADQCSWGHDQCRDVERFQVGQNIASASTTGPFNSNLSAMVTGWYNEVALFNRNQVKSVTDFEDVGHYTQLVWADTKTVGCGVVRYNNDDEWNTTYLVCNYGPTGNWRGGEMYKTR